MNEIRKSTYEVDLGKLAHNYNIIKKHTNAEVLAVVKANGYGHGMVPVAQTLLSCGASMLGVTCVADVAALRKAGIFSPALILDGDFPDNAAKAVELGAIPAVYSLAYAKKLSEAAGVNRTCVPIHIKVDTGMNRIGLPPTEEGLQILKEIAALPHLQLQGIFTHFACADMPDTASTQMQYKKFKAFADEANSMGLCPIVHCCNSAATLKFPEMHHSMVRPGIILYGHMPDESMENTFDFRPISTLKARVSFVKTIHKGDRVSYGGTFEAERDTTVATLPIGYSNGLSRALSNRGYVLIHGEKAPYVGKICMNQCMIDVTMVNNIHVGEEVTIFGPDLPVENLAALSNTICYETLCAVGENTPRVYIAGDGKKYI